MYKTIQNVIKAISKIFLNLYVILAASCENG